MKKRLKKLNLSRETVRNLTSADMYRAAGGASLDTSCRCKLETGCECDSNPDYCASMLRTQCTNC